MSLKVACILVLAMAMAIAGPAAEAAFQCGAVNKNLVPCISFLKGGPGPNPACCKGVSALASMAKTPADRQAACGCLKSSAGAIKGISFANAAALPGDCKVTVPYPISPNTDCSKVH